MYLGFGGLHLSGMIAALTDQPPLDGGRRRIKGAVLLVAWW